MNIRYDEINYADIITFMYTVRFGTVSEAASALNISQPAASKRIASLEKTYGLHLFERKGRALQLTKAGQVFYEGMKVGLNDMLEAFKRATDVQANPMKVLKLGPDGFFDVPLLYEMMTLFNEQYEDTRLEIVNYSFQQENCADLLNGNADLLIVPDAWFSSLHDKVASRPIAAFQFSVLVPKTHPMAQKETVSIRDLKDVPLTVAHVNKNSPYVRAIEQMFHKEGLQPRITHLDERDHICLDILSENSVAIASPAFFSQKNSREEQFYREKIKVYPLADEFYPVSFVWRKNDEDRAIRRFLRIYDQMMEKDENRKIIQKCYRGM